MSDEKLNGLQQVVEQKSANYAQMLNQVAAGDNAPEALHKVFEQASGDEQYAESLQQLNGRRFGSVPEAVHAAALQQISEQIAKAGDEETRKKLLEQQEVLRKAFAEYTRKQVEAGIKQFNEEKAAWEKQRAELKAQVDAGHADGKLLKKLDALADVAAVVNDATLAFVGCCLYSFEGGPSIPGAIPTKDLLQDSFLALGICEGLNAMASIYGAFREGARGNYTAMAQKIGGAITSLLAAVVCVGNKVDIGLNVAKNNMIFFPIVFSLATLVSLMPLAVKLLKGDFKNINLVKDVMPVLLNTLRLLAVMVGNGILASNPFGWVLLAAVTIASRMFAVDQKYGSKQGYGPVPEEKKKEEKEKEGLTHKAGDEQGDYHQIPDVAPSSSRL